MIRINLLKTEKKEIETKAAAAPLEQEAKAKRKAPIENLLVFLVVLILAALAYVQQKSLSTERALLNAALEEKQKLEFVSIKLEQVEQQKVFLQKKIDLINQLKGRQRGTVSILEALSSALPEWVWLTEATLARQNLQIRGRALSNIQISDYMRNLEKSGIFQGVEMLGTTQRNAGGNAFMEFSLSADLAAPPAAGAPSPPPANRPGGPAKKAQGQ
jgi:type IV pilus assembly protein PilN